MGLLEYRDVSKRYGDATAVANFSLDVKEGSLVALIGPSGSGKTTSLRMANRLIEPDDGWVLFEGKPVNAYKPEELRRGMGYVIQHVGLFPHRSVLENVCTVPRLIGTPRARAERRADELLDLVGLDPGQYRSRRPRELSGGEAQRVGVARALAADPPVLLMDEPFGAVDPLQRGRLQEAFLKIQRELKKTVLLVTHDLDEAVRLADSIVLMRDGRVVQEASPAKLLAEPVDDFARDFVGDERSLKRLARVTLGAAMQAAPSVSVGGRAPVTDSGCDGPEGYWVVDAERHPVGRTRPGEIGTASRRKISLLPRSASLKEALALMLEGGPNLIGVLDDDGRLVGELGIVDLLRSSSEACETAGDRA